MSTKNTTADVFVANGNNGGKKRCQIFDIGRVRQYSTCKRRNLSGGTFSHSFSLGLTVHVEIPGHGGVSLEENGVKVGDDRNAMSFESRDGGGDDRLRFRG